MNFRKMKRNFRRNQKAISPVIATLLMIAIAVVASLVTYAWVMGYMGFTTTKTGQSIQIQSVSQTGAVYVQNIGSGEVAFSAPCVFVDGVAATLSGTVPTTCTEGNTVLFTVSGGFATGTHTYTIKVTTESGTFSQVDKVFPTP
jgi:archaeal type IV pilus assembly protein PilA